MLDTGLESREAADQCKPSRRGFDAQSEVSPPV